VIVATAFENRHCAHGSGYHSTRHGAGSRPSYPSGEAYHTGARGYFEWCEESACTFWYSNVKGDGRWYTYLSESNWSAAPFQEGGLLYGGLEPVSDGYTPIPHFSGKFYTFSGTYRTTLRPTGGYCWATTWDVSEDWYQSYCSPLRRLLFRNSLSSGQCHS
jgi:hypothetical protein